MFRPVLLYLWFASIIASSTSVKVELFDSVDFQGPYLTSTNAKGCINLNTSDFIQEARSLKTDICIILFKEVDCPDESHNIRVDPGEYPDLSSVKHETINFLNPLSYRICTGGEGGDRVHVDISGSARDIDNIEPPHDGQLLRYRDVCGCVNLPTRQPYIATVKSIHNYGNCITIYASINCTGTSVKLLGGVSPESLNLTTLGSFIIPSSSIAPCEYRPICTSLSYRFFKFELSTEEHRVSTLSTSEDVALAPKLIIHNKSPSTETHIYEVSKTVTEVIEVTRATNFISTNSYVMDKEVIIGGSVDFKWLQTKISSALTKAYNSDGPNGDKFTSEDSRLVLIKQQIEVPPCTVHNVESHITRFQNYPVNYTVYSYVSAMVNGRQLNAEEVKEMLDEGLTYVEDFDEYTVVASGVGSIAGDFSLDTVVVGEGSTLVDCSGLIDPPTTTVSTQRPSPSSSAEPPEYLI